MKPILTLLSFVIFFSAVSHSQALLRDTSGKFFYTDGNYSEERYDAAFPFDENGFALVKKDNKWFLIDEYFDAVTPKVDSVNLKFSKETNYNTALLQENNQWFLYDVYGEKRSASFDELYPNPVKWNWHIVKMKNQFALIHKYSLLITSRFDTLLLASDGYPNKKILAWVLYQNKIYTLNKKGKLKETDFIPSLPSGQHYYSINGLWYITNWNSIKINKKGIPTNDFFAIPSEDAFFYKRNGKIYMLSHYTRKPTPISYDTLPADREPENNSIRMTLMNYDKDSLHIPVARSKMGYMDIYFNITIPLKFDTVTAFNEQPYAAAKLNGIWVFIDRQGNVVQETDYNSLLPARQRNIYLAQKNYLYGLITTEGKILLDFEYDNLTQYWGNYIVYQKGESRGLYDVERNKKIYEQNTNHLAYTEIGNVIEIHSGNFNCLIDTNGTVLLSNKSYSYKNFNDKYIVVRKLGQFSNVEILYNIAERKFMPDEYTFIARIHNGLALVKKEGKYGYMNEMGEIIIPIIYDKADYYFGYKESNVKLGNKRFKIDTKGNIINN